MTLIECSKMHNIQYSSKSKMAANKIENFYFSVTNGSISMILGSKSWYLRLMNLMECSKCMKYNILWNSRWPSAKLKVSIFLLLIDHFFRSWSQIFGVNKFNAILKNTWKSLFHEIQAWTVLKCKLTILQNLRLSH